MVRAISFNDRQISLYAGQISFYDRTDTIFETEKDNRRMSIMAVLTSSESEVVGRHSGL